MVGIDIRPQGLQLRRVSLLNPGQKKARLHDGEKPRECKHGETRKKQERNEETYGYFEALSHWKTIYLLPEYRRKLPFALVGFVAMALPHMQTPRPVKI